MNRSSKKRVIWDGPGTIESFSGGKYKIRKSNGKIIQRLKPEEEIKFTSE